MILEGLDEEFGGRDAWLNDDRSLLIIVDEAKSVPDGIFQAIQRCNPTRLLVCSSPPLEPTGYFVECFDERLDWFRAPDGTYNVAGGKEDFVDTSYRACPHLMGSDTYVRAAELECALKGEKDSFYRSMYEGKIPEQGGNMIFQVDKVKFCMSGLSRVRYGEGDLGAAIDFSHGGDEIPMYVSNGISSPT